LIPSLLVFVFYLRIYTFVANQTAAITVTATTHELSKSIRLAQGLFCAFTFFIVCWVPYGIVVIADFKDQLPAAVHMFAIELAHFNSALNPVFYAIFSSGFRKGYRLFLRNVFSRCARSRVRVQTVTHTMSAAGVAIGTTKKRATLTQVAVIETSRQLVLVLPQ
jgi:hypothetical protein